MASAQLQLVSSQPDWKLDTQTIEVGRAGIAKARAALESATERIEARELASEVVVQRATAAGTPQTVTQLTIELPMAA